MPRVCTGKNRLLLTFHSTLQVKSRSLGKSLMWYRHTAYGCPSTNLRPSITLPINPERVMTKQSLINLLTQLPPTIKLGVTFIISKERKEVEWIGQKCVVVNQRLITSVCYYTYLYKREHFITHICVNTGVFKLINEYIRNTKNP